MNRRVMLWTAGALLSAVVIGWVLYVPPVALNVYRPLPSHSQVIYSSASPQNLPELPVFGEDVCNFSTVWSNLFKPFAKKPLVIGVAPLGGMERRDTWIAVSAAGTRAFWMRWRLSLFPPKGIQRVRSYGAWPVWQLDDPALPVWARVRFVLTEGLLICSISDDSHDIYYLLDTLDGRASSLADRKGD